MPDPYLFVIGLLVTIVVAVAVGLVGLLDVDDLSVEARDDTSERHRNG